jgi:hypothetical protein
MSDPSETPLMTAGWQQLVMSYALLRRAEFYGVKVRNDLEKMTLVAKRMKEEAERNRPLSIQEKEEEMHRILGTGRFKIN